MIARVDDVAALLRSAAIKKRLEGVTTLAEMLHAHASGDLQIAAEDLAALLPDVLPCLRDHNSKVVSSALESLDVLLAHVSEQTTQSYFKVLWLNLVEKLGDSKLLVRDKAVDVAVQLANVLGVAVVFDRLVPCAQHKNWRTRESTVRCIWRCLDEHDLVTRMKDDVLSHIIKLLEDSAKEVRDAAVETLEHFYARIGPSLLRDLEASHIRSAQMKTLTDRFRSVHRNDNASLPTYTTASSRAVDARSSSNARADTDLLPTSLSSILSGYDLPVTSSSSSMARYLASIRERELSASRAAAAAAAAATGTGPHSPSTSSKSDASVYVDDDDDNDTSSLSDRDIQRDVAAAYESLHLDNDWSKRVAALRALQTLANNVKRMNDSTALTTFAHSLKSVRERLGEQVADLRSTVSREACATIQLLARVLRDDFNALAESCLGALLKATYVTIQVISTAADTCIRGVIESTKSGYARFIVRLLEGAKSRNQVLRLHCVSYLTLTLERWSVNHLSKHMELFLALLPALLHDALSDVRAQSRKCFWAFQRVFPTEGNALLERLDASTQRNLRDDRPSATADNTNATAIDTSAAAAAAATAAATVRPAVRTLKSSRSFTTDATGSVVTGSTGPTASVQRVLQHSASASDVLRATSSSITGPRRVLGASSLESFAESSGIGSTDSVRGPSRVLASGALRVGVDASRLRANASTNDDGTGDRRRQTPARPLRVLTSVESDAAFASRPDASTATAAFHSSAQVGVKAKRIQIAVPTSIDATPSTSQRSNSNRIDQENDVADRSRRVVVSPRPLSATSSFSSSSSSAAATKAPLPLLPTRPTNKSSAAPSSDKVEDALVALRSSSWSVRLDAIEFLRGAVERRALASSPSASATDSIDDRVVRAFVSHLSDGHYRVAHASLRGIAPLLQVASASQVTTQLRLLLPALAQRQIETKESVRVVARAALDTLADRIDATVLTAAAVPLLVDGGNMKVRAVLCNFVRTLLPRATAFANSSTQLRALLVTLAALVASDMPVSVVTAGRDLLVAAVSVYRVEVEAAMPQLPPSKRAVLLKALKAKGVKLQTSSGGGLSDSNKTLGASTTSSRGSNNSSSGSHDVVVATTAASDNQTIETAATTGVERTSRKRSESPNTNAASPQRTVQKRKSADASSSVSVATTPADALAPAAATRTPPYAPTAAAFNSWLDTLSANNATDRERRTALLRVLTFITTGSGADAIWTQSFERLLFLLLDADRTDMTALKVLHGLVEAQPQRAHSYAATILNRLLDGLTDRVDIASHLAETVLLTLVSSSQAPETLLALLAPRIAQTEPPTLQVVLRLVKAALEATERAGLGGDASVFVACKPQWLDQVLAPVAALFAHSSSDVRKTAVSCVVAYYFAVHDDADAVVWGFLADSVDVTKKKLVQIFIDRAKLERRQIAAPAAPSS